MDLTSDLEMIPDVHVSSDSSEDYEVLYKNNAAQINATENQL